ncbi:MAG: ribosome small subunit-dependent GTPase A [Zoogloeaceae bacterium]|nr:ribosome small subunit-dependent GTPase A [Zoogloeaceae bacterium]
MSTLSGQVVAAFGRQYEVELTGGERLLCFPRGKRSNLACGDRVHVERSGDGVGVINNHLERHSLLYRSDAWKQKLIAANVTQLVLVVATEPSFSDELLSRCICAAESEDIASLIVLNKTDLHNRLAAAREALACFSSLGYDILELSAHADVEAFRGRLLGHCSVLVGQSGMGKSTLTNALVPEAKAATREISESLDSGKHTTTFARMYRLDKSSQLIDCPGLQTFGLAHLDQGQLLNSFREFRPFIGTCRFRDCRHDAEPGCALLHAVAAGQIDSRRWAHYRQFRSELEEAKRLSQGW